MGKQTLSCPMIYADIPSWTKFLRSLIDSKLELGAWHAIMMRLEEFSCYITSTCDEDAYITYASVVRIACEKLRHSPDEFEFGELRERVFSDIDAMYRCLANSSLSDREIGVTYNMAIMSCQNHIRTLERELGYAHQ